ncbi:MAG: hypothetical protein ACOH1T_03005 [Microbacteriaceae bacterium]
MFHTTHKVSSRARRVAFSLTAGAILALALAGCADSVSSGPTLVSTKSSTQLLAGEAVSRVSAFITSGGKTYEDLSEACADTAKDPDGLQRLWRSSATVTLKKGVTLTSDAILDNLAESFSEQGWVSQNRSKGEALQLSNGKSQSTLRFKAEALEDGTGGTLLIEARGACVTTGGADSDEVMKLENRTR